MRSEPHEAYVLHARPYRETSLLLECLTRTQGRLGVVARGVRGERSRAKRAQLEPFQPLSMGLALRGELATLTSVEETGIAYRLVGGTALSGLYLNELLVRLTPRHDPSPCLFDAYGAALVRLASGESPAWTLRRFERDLLAGIGYALPLRQTADAGNPLRPDRHYRYDPEQGAMECASSHPCALSGDALLALADDRMPGPEDLKRLRGMMREIIRFHLGGAELRAWRVLAAAARR